MQQPHRGLACKTRMFGARRCSCRDSMSATAFNVASADLHVSEMIPSLRHGQARARFMPSLNMIRSQDSAPSSLLSGRVQMSVHAETGAPHMHNLLTSRKESRKCWKSKKSRQSKRPGKVDKADCVEGRQQTCRNSQEGAAGSCTDTSTITIHAPHTSLPPPLPSASSAFVFALRAPDT